MELIITIFDQVLYLPLFNALILIYNILPVHDLGIAIIILTVIIRLLLYPLSRKSIRSQKTLSQLHPQIKQIQEKYQNKEEQARAMMELYQRYKINPMSGCLPLLIQFPILIALYRVFFTGLDINQLSQLYNFVNRPESLNLMFLGLINLSRPSIFLALIAGGLQFIQAKMINPSSVAKQLKNKKRKSGFDFSVLMNQQMTYFMPLITVFIALRLPAALPLYWIVVTLFGIIQQHLVARQP